MSRIASLPLRSPDLDEREIGPLTSWLRKPAGTMRLRPIQARSCLEILRVRGLVLSGRVGAGKSLTAGLAARLLDLKRPLLVTDASVVTDTQKLLASYRQHWHIPPIQVISYTKISQRSAEQRARVRRGEDPGPGFLDLYRADGLLLDEAHRLKRIRTSANSGSACARRFSRWIYEHPEVPVCSFSGTFMRDSIRDYSHLLVWSLKRGAPVPLDPELQTEWALLLDEERPSRDGYTRTPDYEILTPHLGPCHDRESARQAFQHRLLWTPGIVVSQDSFDDVPLEITPIEVPTPEALAEPWGRLRELWEAPDGWVLPDQQQGVWGVANQLALGFYYRHEPRPPRDWADARREWCGFCRQILEGSTTLDTETDVRNACLAGRLPRQIWDAWDAIRDSYQPTRVPEWLSLHALVLMERWGLANRKRGAIIWVNYRAVGEALSERTGWPYYGPGGVDSRGQAIGDARPDRDPVVIVSTRVAEVGKNLQGDPSIQKPGYTANLFTTPPRAAADWEQRVGRTHRDGQIRPVLVEYLVGCAENFAAMPQSIALARLAESGLQPSQKLLRWAAVEPPLEWAHGPAYDTRKKKENDT